MTNLQHRQQKIQEKRKQTPFREFLMEIASRYPMNLYKHTKLLSIYPESDRQPKIVDKYAYMEYQEDNINR